MSRGSTGWRRWARAIGRGGRQRCPRCGRGPLFERWNRVRERCPHCDLRYLLNQGDPWVFLLIIDRAVFIFPPIVLIYFAWTPGGYLGMGIMLAALVGAILYTTPHRYGICIALDYLTRRHDADPTIGYPS